MLLFIKRLSLIVKLNALLVGVFAALLLALLIITNNSFSTLINQVSQEELALDVSTVQLHFTEIQSELIDDARLLSFSPGLIEAVETDDVTQLRAIILQQATALGLDDIDVVSADGERLLTVAAPDVVHDFEEENRLIAAALLGADVTGIVSEGDGLLLSAIVPLKDANGTVVGAVLAGRQINDAFMNTLNFDRLQPSLAFIFGNEVISQSQSTNDELYDIDEDFAAIAQAQQGQAWFSKGLVIDEDNTPDRKAYIPLSIGGEVLAVLGVRGEFQTLLAFQADLTTRNIVLVTLLSVLAVLAIAIFVQKSIARPLDRLKTTAGQIAGGDLKHRVKIASEDEIGQLGQSFNAMSGQLEARLEETQAARERAEKSDKVKSAFLASMSHELRTPLNSIINFSKFVARGVVGPVNQEQEEMLYEVVDSAKQLLNLINDVLDMSKIESGSLTLFIEDDVNVVTIIDMVTTTGHSLLDEKPVTIQKELAADLPLMRGDRQRILQILLNVMSNACKFTESGTITLRAYRHNEDIHISVQDTGPGIALEDQAAVFESFKQTKTGMRQGGGTGLGMPISKSLVEAHHGQFWLESVEGQGATFFVSLPIRLPQLMPLDLAKEKTA